MRRDHPDCEGYHDPRHVPSSVGHGYRPGHYKGWSAGCQCRTCRADRIAKRVIIAVLILGIGYLVAHVLIAHYLGRI